MHDAPRPTPLSPPLAGAETPERDRILDPIDRNSEILFGLFMVLTFTCTLSVATAGRNDVRTMLAAAIGCNIAWGFVDAMMYVLRNLVERGRRARLARAVRAAADPQGAQRVITEEIGPMAAALAAPELERIRQWIAGHPELDKKVTPTARDFKGALGVFLLVVASTFPPVLPFVFFPDLKLAMRVSGAIAIAMMFYCGYVWGRHAGFVPWRSGLVLAILGVVIEAIVIALGG
jgi:VIT1/CCC1 family predicted Fe2+/Mn2+ transporter